MIATRATAFRAPLSCWVALDRLTQRARRRLERGFEDVVRVAPAQEIDVEVHARGLGEGAPEVLRQLDRKVADQLSARLHFVDEVEATGEIDHGAAQALVHRHEPRAVARDAALVAERLG
jgi:hypothetical protein